jgi:hypothetical protein
MQILHTGNSAVRYCASAAFAYIDRDADEGFAGHPKKKKCEAMKWHSPTISAASNWA